MEKEFLNSVRKQFEYHRFIGEKTFMTRPIILILLTLTFGCQQQPTEKPTTMSDDTEQKDNTTPTNDTTPKVTGIGGIFFFSEDPEKTRKWYAEHLGLEVNEWGSSFEFRNANRPEEINYLQWSPFKHGSEYFAPSKKEFMINYRVQNIEGLVIQLEKSGVTVVDSITEYDYGKFVHIMDAEGNKIELWEPVDTVFTEMGGETNK